MAKRPPHREERGIRGVPQALTATRSKAGPAAMATPAKLRPHSQRQPHTAALCLQKQQLPSNNSLKKTPLFLFKNK